MAVPKKKMSRSRTRRRQAQWKVSAPRTAPCPQCNAARLPHHACPQCGTYRGREVVDPQA
ncbi:MAG: 50S ribosomal protein L32 [Acidimicrobiia bacterium]|nr:50S ribosomal protein L32 [Acidimicrobiia bacterium]NNF65138.1 50S ribosomal protein L32 [Acidimicrobiia bacterium]